MCIVIGLPGARIANVWRCRVHTSAIAVIMFRVADEDLPPLAETVHWTERKLKMLNKPWEIGPLNHTQLVRGIFAITDATFPAPNAA